MDGITVIEPMNADEARTAIASIKAHFSVAEESLRAARARILEFFERAGWVALGYPNMELCARTEFGKSWQHIYRLKDAAIIERNLLHSPAGELLTPETPERQLRPLNRLDTPEQQARAMTLAAGMARAEGGAVTGVHVEQAVAVVSAEDQVRNSSYNPVAHAMDRGDITAATALAMIKHLRHLNPRVQAYVLELMTKWGLTCADLIPEIAQMYDRPTGRESYTLPPIEASGHVAGVPLAKATLTDLKRARYEAQKEHLSDQQVQQPSPTVEPVVITVYKGDAKRTLKALRASLRYQDLIELQKLLGEL